jgi:hypothetical protein
MALECSKWGRVVHIHVGRETAVSAPHAPVGTASARVCEMHHNPPPPLPFRLWQGYVHLMFDEVGSAIAAAQALNGRPFGGSVLAVEYITVPDYVSRFPEVSALV